MGITPKNVFESEDTREYGAIHYRCTFEREQTIFEQNRILMQGRGRPFF